VCDDDDMSGNEGFKAALKSLKPFQLTWLGPKRLALRLRSFTTGRLSP